MTGVAPRLVGIGVGVVLLSALALYQASHSRAATPPVPVISQSAP